MKIGLGIKSKYHKEKPKSNKWWHSAGLTDNDWLLTYSCKGASSLLEAASNRVSENCPIEADGRDGVRPHPELNFNPEKGFVLVQDRLDIARTNWFTINNVPGFRTPTYYFIRYLDGDIGTTNTAIYLYQTLATNEIEYPTLQTVVIETVQYGETLFCYCDLGVGNEYAAALSRPWPNSGVITQGPRGLYLDGLLIHPPNDGFGQPVPQEYDASSGFQIAISLCKNNNIALAAFGILKSNVSLTDSQIAAISASMASI